MKISALLHRRLHWINLPGAVLLALLQRTPVLNVVAIADEMVVSSPVGAVLKSVVAAVAALGAMNSLAGATPLVPSAGSPAGISVAAGSAISVFYTVNGTLTPPVSWEVTGSIPTGLDFSGLTGSGGSVNVGPLHLEGTATTPGTYSVSLQTFQFLGDGGIGSPIYPYTITVTGSGVTSPPSFTTQPVSQTVTAGSAVSFTVAVNGSPTPTLQWEKDGVNLSGATSATFSIASARTSDAGSYMAIATNSAGSVISNSAALTVTAATSAPAFTTQPSGQSVTAGSAATFTVTVSGSPTPSIQWQKSGVNIAGGTGISYSIASVAASDAGSYMAIATNSAGSAASSSATLTVTAATSAPAFTTQPSSQSAIAGSAVAFTVAVSGSPTPSIQWQKSGVNIAGGTGTSYSIASVAASDAGSYMAIATNSAGSATSSSATLTVSAPLPSAASFTTQPTPQTVSISQRATFTVAGGGNPAPTYQWQRLPAGATTWENLSEGGSYHGVTTNTLTVDTATAAMAGDQFRCLIANSLGNSTSSAVVLTVSGSGSVLLQYPASIAEDSSGNFYVADASSNTIQKITPAGSVRTLAGTAGMAGSQDGTGASALFNQPSGVAVDGGGNVYVADTGNATIRKITPTGAVTTLAGSPVSRGSHDGTGSSAQFNQPTGLAVDSAGSLYVADSFNATIRKVAADGTVSTLAGTAGGRGDADGTGAAAQFNNPNGVALDTAGNLYVADTYNDTIREITPAGVVTTLAGSAGLSGSADLTRSNALFNQPYDVAVDTAGNIYVTDTGNATIRRVAPGGAVTTLAGLANIAGMGDSASGVALFNQPRGLVVDSAGNLFVADTGNAAIRKVTADGTVTTMALQAAAGATPPPPSGGTPPPSPGPMSGGGNGGGGGGAMETWFVALLALLGAARLLARRR
jgi:sugar lactone lactonase YvrE